MVRYQLGSVMAEKLSLPVESCSQTSVWEQAAAVLKAIFKQLNGYKKTCSRNSSSRRAGIVLIGRGFKGCVKNAFTHPLSLFHILLPP